MANPNTMRHTRGYKNLLRGDATMLAPVQKSSIRWATFLSGIYRRWLPFVFWPPILIMIGDAFIRSEYFDAPFETYGLTWMAVIFCIELLLFPIAALIYRRVTSGDPFRTAQDDADHMLVEARNRAGKSATVKDVAGNNKAMFLADFYEIKSFYWLGAVVVLVMVALLCVSYIPRYQYYDILFDESTSKFQDLEDKISTAWEKSGDLCQEIYSADKTGRSYTSHYSRCTIEFDDETKFTATVNITDDYQIEDFNFRYEINQEIESEIPHRSEINSYMESLVSALSPLSGEFLDPNILNYDYSIDVDFEQQLANDEFKEQYYVLRDAITSEDCIKKVYLSYAYYEHSDSTIHNYIYISSN